MITDRGYFHLGSDVPLLGLTIPEHFSTVTERFPDRDAIVSLHQRRRLSYRQLMRETDRAAKALLVMGYSRGDRVGVWATNNIEWLILQLATARVGVLLVNINPANRPRELAHALDISEVQGLFTIPSFRSSNYIAMLSDLMPELSGEDIQTEERRFPNLRHIVVYDPARPNETASALPGILPWQSFLDGAETVSDDRLDAATAELDADDPINIQYTSGTTGFPKAVVLTHHNILNNAYFTAQAMGFGERDRLCVPVPFYHCFGMVLSNLLCLSVGAAIVIPSEHFDPLAVLQAIGSENCTAVHGVPTMFIAELDHPKFEAFDMTSLRTGIMAGAPCPPELMKRVMNDMHCAEILIGYGQTEASPITHLTRPDDSLERRTETVGRNLPHQEAKVVDTTTGHIVPLGDIGEICFRGYHVMRGYFNNEEATRSTIDDAGWLHSGDLGSMDGEGYLRITGRLKEMIIRGGENIYPAEIEAFLFSLPEIAQVAVFGVPDPRLGEQVVAWIQCHAGEQLTEEDVIKACRGNLAYFKIPKIIRFVDEFPMTVTGKLQKFRMREMMIADMEAS